jgi:hypothetical protein
MRQTVKSHKEAVLEARKLGQKALDFRMSLKAKADRSRKIQDEEKRRKAENRHVSQSKRYKLEEIVIKRLVQLVSLPVPSPLEIHQRAKKLYLQKRKSHDPFLLIHMRG